MNFYFLCARAYINVTKNYVKTPEKTLEKHPKCHFLKKMLIFNYK